MTQAPLNLTDRLADAYLGLSVDAHRHAEYLRREVYLFLLLLLLSLSRQISESGVADAPRVDWQVSRQNKLFARFASIVGGAYGTLGDWLQRSLRGFAEVHAGRAASILAGLLPDVTVSTPGVRAIRQAADGALVQGARPADWWQKQARDMTLRLSAQVRQASSAGESSAQMLARVRGQSTGNDLALPAAAALFAADALPDGLAVDTTEVPEFAGGVFQTSQNEASMLVRAAVQAAMVGASDAVAEDNLDAFRGQQAFATLDANTTDFCRARDGTMWDFDGNPLPDSPKQFPYPGPTPWHWGCRTILVPVPVGAEPGSVDSFESWLNAKPEVEQQDVLGPLKWKLWKGGGTGLTLSQLIDQSGNPLSLEDLKQRAGEEEQS